MLTIRIQNRFKIIFTFIILGFSAACQPTFVPVSPSPKALPAVQVTVRPTQTPRGITQPTGTPIPTPFPSPTPFPGDSIQQPIESQAIVPPALGQTVVSPLQIVPSVTRIVPTLPSVTPGTPGTPTATLVLTLAPNGSTFKMGTSVEGRDIWAWQFGIGEKIVLLVGGVHGGFEANTVVLINEMIARFQSTPADVMPGITLVLVPVLNPDGLALGRRIDGRFNANHVDLNRNWGCEWSAEAYFKDQLVDPGPRAFSEPETAALALWIRTERPAAAIFYHSAANGVFAGGCEDSTGSDGLAAILGEAAGYPYGSPFSAYTVSGTESAWVDGLGIPSVDVELTNTRDSEFWRNIKGVQAVQCWLLGQTC